MEEDKLNMLGHLLESESHLSLTILSSLYLGLFCLSRLAAPPSFFAIAFFSFRTKCYKKTMGVQQNNINMIFLKKVL